MESVKWNWEITPKTSWIGASLKELLEYKDLLFRLVRKEIILGYQQTVLGPFWTILQPVVSVLIYVLVFHHVIQVPIYGFPPFLFYLISITLWNYFSDIFNGTCSTFSDNEDTFNKVYFPRLIMPLSTVVMHLIRLLMHFLFIVVVLFVYYLMDEVTFSPIKLLLIIPVILSTGGIALGAGLISSVLTAKYRDFHNITHHLFRILLFVCPVFYSSEIVPAKYKMLYSLNPLAGQFEAFRYAFLGSGHFNFYQLIYGFLFMITVMIMGLALFNKVGDKLIDVL